MRRIAISIVTLLLGVAPACLAQNFEVGILGGYGVQKGLTAEAGGSSADTGFRSGGALGAFGGEDLYDYVSGEVRYLYRWSDLRVESGGEEATFSGQSNIVHFDLLFHAQPRESKVRPFFAVGGGLKVFQGTGVERAFQPLSQFVLLTKKTEILPLFAFGGGVKVALRDHLNIRLEVRDYLTPSPEKVLVPAPGASIKGLLHDIVPLLGISYRF